MQGRGPLCFSELWYVETLIKLLDTIIIIIIRCGNMEKQYVLLSLQESLNKLQLDYLDLFLVHSPVAFSHTVTDLTNIAEDDKLGYDECRVVKSIAVAIYCSYYANSDLFIQGMEEAVSEGLTRTIGISNFTITKTESLLKTAKIVPAVNQVECHPYFQQKKLREYCDTKGKLNDYDHVIRFRSSLLHIK